MRIINNCLQLWYSSGVSMQS